MSNAMKRANERLVSQSPIWQAALHEVGIVGLGFCLYLVVRTLTQGGQPEAMANAFALSQLEVHLGVAWEGWLQSLAVGSEVARSYFNYVYIFGYWPVLATALVALFVTSRPHYYWLRNALLLSGGLGLVIFALYPVAPPRLSDPAIVDTIASVSGGPLLARPASLVNEFAAMPSFHAGWILLASMAMASAWRGRAVQVVCVLMTLQMAIVVVVTGNHFVVDVAVGCAIAILALGITSRLSGVAPAQPQAEGPPQPAT